MLILTQFQNDALILPALAGQRTILTGFYESKASRGVVRMLPPVVDITSLYAVESLFRPGTRDPWGEKLAGRLADLFIFSDKGRFTMPLRAEAATVADPSLPVVLAELQRRDSGVFDPLPYVVNERPRLNNEYLEPAFRLFATWASNNKGAFKQWLTFHREVRTTPRDITYVRPNSVFDISALVDVEEFQHLRVALNESSEDLIYAFDIVLRYPLYGQLAGSGSYFLAHPIREQQNSPIIAVEPGRPPNVPVSFSQAVTGMVSSMTIDEYTSFLHEARGLIRDRKIDQLQVGAIDRDTTRELASQLGLPARLNKAGRTVGIAAGIVGMVGAVPAFGPAAAIAGGLITIVSAAWTGSVGRTPGRVKWLRWALEWDLEHQASDIL